MQRHFRLRPAAGIVALACICAASLAGAAAPVRAQRLIERTPNLPNSVTVLPGMLEASLTHRFARDVGAAGVAGATGIGVTATFDLALGLPFLLPVEWSPGLRFVPASAAAGRDEWEVYERLGLLRQDAGAPLDVVATGAYRIRGGGLDGEAALARRLGPLRVIGAARVLSATGDDGDGTRFAVAGGAVLHLRPGGSPLVIAADIASPTDRRPGERAAWSAGVATGLPHTPLSLSLHATNVGATTLHAASAGGSRTRWGVEVNTPVEFVGFLLGMYASRERALRAVQAVGDVAPAGAPVAATVRMRGYLYAPSMLRIRAGDVVEWINDDDVVHTVTSENAGFDSRAIQPRARWRARFAEPGIYPYYCGPHPFMKGVVVVR